jgi:hypothetical protein
MIAFPAEVWCELASWLNLDDFKSFVAASRATAQCRHDLKTVCQVLVNEHGVNAARYVLFRNLSHRLLPFLLHDAPERQEAALRSIVDVNHEYQRKLSVLQPLVDLDVAKSFFLRHVGRLSHYEYCDQYDLVAILLSMYELFGLADADLVAQAIQLLDADYGNRWDDHHPLFYLFNRDYPHLIDREF